MHVSVQPAHDRAGIGAAADARMPTRPARRDHAHQPRASIWPTRTRPAALAARLARLARSGDVLALSGELGVGKTAFARAFIRARTGAPVGGAEPDLHPGPDLRAVPSRRRRHLSLRSLSPRCRRRSLELGIEDAFAGGISLIEWPDRLGRSLPAARLDRALRRCARRRRRRRRARRCAGPAGDWPRSAGRGRALTERRDARIAALPRRRRLGRGARCARSPATPRSAATPPGDGPARAVLMDAPPEHEDVRPFVRIARHLRALGLSAPEIFAADVDAGLLLLEDLGDDTFTRLLAAGADEATLYALAIDVLVDLHRACRRAGRSPPGCRATTAARLLDEALLLIDWYLPAVLAAPRHRQPRATPTSTPGRRFCRRLAQPPTLVLRDYHVDNLMRLPGAPGRRRLRPARLPGRGRRRRGLRSDVAARGRAARHRRAAARGDAGALSRRALHRPTGRLSTRLTPSSPPSATPRSSASSPGCSRRDGKPGYLVHIPRVWRLLERALAHPALAPVAAWFDGHVPAARRAAPLLGNGGA